MAGDLLIPPRLARTVVEWEGDAGRAWLAWLPELVAELAANWDLEVGPPLLPGGQISWVAPARWAGSDEPLVLKVQLPHPESDPEAAGLRAWGGDGAVRLHRDDPVRRALLIERCRPGHGVGELPGDLLAAKIGAALAARLHRATAPAGLPTLSSVLDAWADELEGRLDRHGPADPGLGRSAVATFRDRPRASPRDVLLHGDLNPTNVLSAEREPWLAIDAKPMVGDPAYDGVRLVTQPDPLATADAAATVASRLAVVAEGLGVERGDLAVWCVAGVVEMAVSARSHGDHRKAAGIERILDLLRGHLP